ncbi:hypothetical protein M3596_22070 [Bacillus subtilis]|uniref:CD3337/EF1877 family mobilome membrane protein n=1 Tax=Bacillus subtilis TaxID=1423 RepID=UPI00203B9687|nr:hypothetical protein [Bacillus subtilis]MCM3191402.1 hypothetical protein [Bacillus subtilis]
MKNPKSFKRVGILSLLVFLFCFLPTDVHAQTADDAADQFKTEEKQYGPYKDSDKPARYKDIDVATYDEQKEVEDKAKDDDKGFTLNPFTAIGNYFSDTADDTIGSVKDMIVSMFLMIVQAIFQFNIMMTDFLMSCLDASMNGSIINFMIDLTENKIQDLAGISGTSISSKGLYGSLGGLFALISVGYMVYLYFIKRAPLEAARSLLQPLLSVFIAIALIGNLGTVLKGINSMTTEFSSVISTATQDKGDGTRVDTMQDGIYKMMIHRPWLYLQFGSANEDEIGKKRIEALLLNQPDSDKKRKAIKSEISEYGNEMVQPGSIITRLVYVSMFTGVNGFLSIPLWILSFIFLTLQIYFVIVACLAPFVLIWSVLPNQFSIVRRYSVELIYPMAVKLMISFLALILFTISDIVYKIPMTKGLGGYYISVYVQLVILLVLFFMRKRIAKLFAGTQGYLNEIRRSTDLVKDPVKKSVENTATLAGAAVGATVGGPQGAMAGANLGKNIGKTAVGEGDPTATASALMSMNMASASVDAASTKALGSNSPEEIKKGLANTVKLAKKNDKSESNLANLPEGAAKGLDSDGQQNSTDGNMKDGSNVESEHDSVDKQDSINANSSNDYAQAPDQELKDLEEVQRSKEAAEDEASLQPNDQEQNSSTTQLYDLNEYRNRKAETENEVETPIATADLKEHDSESTNVNGQSTAPATSNVNNSPYQNSTDESSSDRSNIQGAVDQQENKPSELKDLNNSKGDKPINSAKENSRLDEKVKNATKPTETKISSTEDNQGVRETSASETFKPVQEAASYDAEQKELESLERKSNEQ